MKNKSVKLPFVTKNSKHLVGTSGDDSSALIEFSLVKNKSVKLPFVTKKQYLVTFAYNKNKTIVTRTYNVNVKTVSNLNSLVSSKTCPKN